MSTPRTYANCDTAPLWSAYLADRSDTNRNAIVLAHMPLVEVICGAMTKNLPSYADTGDLFGAASIGLIKAIASFDPNRGVPFRHYAGTRIRGEILDYLRSIDTIKRQCRDRAKLHDRVVESLTQALSCPPTPEEVVDQLRVLGHRGDLADFRSHGTLSMSTPIEVHGDLQGEIAATIVDERADDPTKVAEQREIVGEAFRVLPPVASMMITFYFFNGDSLATIGRRIGLCEAAISVRVRRAVQVLQQHFQQVAA